MEETPQEPQQTVELTDNTTELVPMYKGVPYDLIQHFSVNNSELSPKVRDRLGEIYRMLDGENFDQKINSLIFVEQKLGKGNPLTPRYDKVWNWLRLNKAIKDTRGERARLRQEALEESQRI